jgi:D-sedoheptulose 7-phosphate isomerase
MPMHEVAIQHDSVLAVESAALNDNQNVTRQVDVLMQERSQSMACAVARLSERTDAIAAIAEALVETLRSGGKVLVAGNGGSAAEAQHFAGELVGRFLVEREAYAALALCVDSAVVTAIANDYGYDNVFARQIQGLGRPGDLFIAISTSGASTNLLRAAEVARDNGLRVATITGDRANPLEGIADYPLRVPATSTPLIQELQMMVTHVLCGIAEAELSSRASVNCERGRE